MSYRTMGTAMRQAERNGYKLFYAEFGEFPVSRLYKGKYFILSRPETYLPPHSTYDGSEARRWLLRHVAPDGGVWSADCQDHLTFAGALAAMRWIIKDDQKQLEREAERKAYRKEQREAKKPRRSRSRAFDETAHYRCLG